MALEFLDNPALNTDTPNGQFMMTILGAVAELARSVVRERQMEGISLLKAEGRYTKKQKLTVEQIKDARQRVGSGVPKAAVARELEISRQRLYTALGGAGWYVEVVS